MFVTDATKKNDINALKKEKYEKIDRFDLIQVLKINPDSSFLMRVTGFSMINAGINSGDIVVADKNLIPKSGDIVIAEINNRLTIKRLAIEDNRYVLKAENDNYKSIKINDDDTFNIWGVVRQSIQYV